MTLEERILSLVIFIWINELRRILLICKLDEVIARVISRSPTTIRAYTGADQQRISHAFYAALVKSYIPMIL